MVYFKIENKDGTEITVKGISKVVEHLNNIGGEWEANEAFIGPVAVIREEGRALARDALGNIIKITAVRGTNHH